MVSNIFFNYKDEVFERNAGDKIRSILMIEHQRMYGVLIRLQNQEKDQNFANNGNKLQKSSIYYRKMNKMWLEKENGSI